MKAVDKSRMMIRPWLWLLMVTPGVWGLTIDPNALSIDPNYQTTPKVEVKELKLHKESMFMGKDRFVDFDQGQRDPVTGQTCFVRDSLTQGLSKEPIVECSHKQMKVCHFTYETHYKPHPQRVCEDNFEKSCQITFEKRVVNETLRKCYNQVDFVCDDEGVEIISNGIEQDDECRTFYETVCTTRYTDKGQDVLPKTSCRKVPRKLCGRPNCRVVQLPEKCFKEMVATVMEVPEEHCDLQPQKVCRFETKLVPNLTPREECSFQPREVCHFKFGPPVKDQKKLKIRWCLPHHSLPDLQQSKPRKPQDQNKDSYGTPLASVVTKATPSPVYYKPLSLPAPQLEP